MIRSLFSALSAAAAVAIAATPLLSCRNEAGAPVDSWVAIKAPAGTSYFYADPASPTLALSPYSMKIGRAHV